MIRYIRLAATALMLADCSPTTVPIDQVAMYGGIDREANPTLRKGDQELIDGAVSAFGSRRKSSKAWADKAFRDYASGNCQNGIRRFNQAWLLDKSNPESYWGFGLWYGHLGDREAEQKMFEKAYGLGLREEEFLKTYRESKTQ